MSGSYCVTSSVNEAHDGEHPAEIVVDHSVVVVHAAVVPARLQQPGQHKHVYILIKRM